MKYLDGNRKREKDGKFELSPYNFPVQPDFPGYTEEYYRTIVNSAGDRLKNKELEK